MTRRTPKATPATTRLSHRLHLLEALASGTRVQSFHSGPCRCHRCDRVRNLAADKTDSLAIVRALAGVVAAARTCRGAKIAKALRALDALDGGR